ncbi:MAG: homoserine O-succinyltransferase [Steroidobacteraceae bacterium]|nr:homoserine O-succinyltransferase [Steroidobacteraceae bacterium]
MPPAARSPVQPDARPPVGYEDHCRVLDLAGPFALHFGARLPRVSMAYRLAGRAEAPVVAVLGGISAGRHVFSLPGRPAGWWDEIVGPGRALDTDRFRILGLDFLGGSHETTGPTPGGAFPSVSAFDQAELLERLADHLGIDALQGCVGASYGGMVALALAERYPRRLRHAVVISAAHRTHPMSTAWRSVQRAIVRYALGHGEGARGLALARALAMATYRSAREFEERFHGPAEATPAGFRFPVESYLFARGETYAAQYRPEAFVCLSESIDLHRVNPEAIGVPTTLVGIEEDQLVPLADLRELRDRLAGSCRLVEISSIYGHDAFLKETEVLRDVFARALEPA